MKNNTASIATNTGETIVALAIVFLILGGIAVVGISAEQQPALAATCEVTTYSAVATEAVSETEANAETAELIESISDVGLFWIGLCVIAFLFILCMGSAASGDHYGGF